MDNSKCPESGQFGALGNFSLYFVIWNKKTWHWKITFLGNVKIEK